jgi:GNAT superfamily N-acetyltransferase
MVPETILELFDAQIRGEGAVSGDDWSAVLRPPADGDVDRQIAWMREQPGYVEWKYYAHDGPELEARLLAAGLVPDDEETVLAAEASAIPPVDPDVDVREATEEFIDLAHQIFGGRRRPLPERSVGVVALVDGQPVSGGRIDFEPDVDFAGLYGGVTLPEFRGRGLYRATVAKRAALARDRGYRYLYVDALPTSRPILERLGFVAITTTRPFTDPRASSSD